VTGHESSGITGPRFEDGVTVRSSSAGHSGNGFEPLVRGSSPAGGWSLCAVTLIGSGEFVEAWPLA